MGINGQIPPNYLTRPSQRAHPFSECSDPGTAEVKLTRHSILTNNSHFKSLLSGVIDLSAPAVPAVKGYPLHNLGMTSDTDYIINEYPCTALM